MLTLVLNSHCLPIISPRSGEVAFSPNGKTLASGRYDKILLWDTTTRKHLKTFNRENSLLNTLTFTNDGKTLLFESHDGSVILLDVKTGEKTDFQPKSSRGFGAHLSSLFGRGVSAADLFIDNINNNKIFAVGHEDGKNSVGGCR